MAQETITIFLFKESVTSFSELIDLDDSYNQEPPEGKGPIRKSVNLSPITLKDTETEAKVLWTDKTPDWSKLVSEFVEEDVEERFRNKSHSAVLLIKSCDRFFAMTFGHSGRRIIKYDLVVERFGLLVALNSIDPNEVRFADAIAAAELQIRTTKTASRNTNINNLGLALYENDDLLAITGRPIEEESSFANSITGADALRLKLEISKDNLISTLQDTLRLYKSDKYKDNFPFYEKLEFVNDGAVRETLQNRLRELTNEHGFRAFSIGIFSVEEPESIFSYVLQVNGNEYECDDVDIDSLEEIVSDHLTGQHQDLLDSQIKAVGHDGEVWKVLPFLECITAEIIEQDETYVLLLGRWRKVSKDYIQRVNEKIDSIPSIELDLPPFNKSKKGSDTARKGDKVVLSENAYNKRISEISDLELKLMDCVRSIRLGLVRTG